MKDDRSDADPVNDDISRCSCRDCEGAAVNAYEYLIEKLRSCTGSERGASLVEYALLLTMIAVVCIVAVQFLGHELSQSFDSVGDSVDTAGT